MRVARVSKAFLDDLNDVKEILMQLRKEFSFINNDINLLNFSGTKISSEGLDKLMNTLNDILRQITGKADPKIVNEYAARISNVSKDISDILAKQEYDFFRQCGKCGKCCISPHVFSFEKEFVKNYFDKLEYYKGFFRVKGVKGRCIFYNSKDKSCKIHDNRPIDCRLFPYSFILKEIAAEDIDVSPRRYIFLLKAKGCPVSDNFSITDSLNALYFVSFIISKINLEEALYYSSLLDPKRMELTFSVPYDEKEKYIRKLEYIAKLPKNNFMV